MSVVQNNTISTNSITEATSANGVTIDGVKLKDNGVIVGDGGTIGSASDTDAISISSGGYVVDSARPHFVVDATGSSSVEIAHNGRVPFNEEVRDHGGNFDTSNYWFLTPVAGVYMFHAKIYTYHATVVAYSFYIMSHDDDDGDSVTLTRVRDARSSNSGQHIFMTAISYLSANRRISVINGTGSARHIYLGTQDHSTFSGCLIG